MYYRRPSTKQIINANRRKSAQPKTHTPKYDYPVGYVSGSIIAREACTALNDPRIRSTISASVPRALAQAGLGTVVKNGSAIRFNPTTDEGKRLYRDHVEADPNGNEVTWPIYHRDAVSLVAKYLLGRAERKEETDGMNVKNEYPEGWATLTMVMNRLNSNREASERLTVIGLRDILVKKIGLMDFIDGKISCSPSVLEDGHIKLYDGLDREGKPASWYIYDLKWLLPELAYYFLEEQKKARAKA